MRSGGDRIGVHLYTTISQNPGANTTIYVPKNSLKKIV